MVTVVQALVQCSSGSFFDVRMKSSFSNCL